MWYFIASFALKSFLRADFSNEHSVSFALNEFVSPIAVDAGCEKRPKRILVPY